MLITKRFENVVVSVSCNRILRLRTSDLPQAAAGLRAADGEGGGHDLRQLEGAHHVQHQTAQVKTQSVLSFTAVPKEKKFQHRSERSVSPPHTSLAGLWEWGRRCRAIGCRWRWSATSWPISCLTCSLTSGLMCRLLKSDRQQHRRHWHSFCEF